MDGLTAALDAAEAALGPVDILVNNAAYTAAGDLHGISLEAWHREIDVNVNGTYHCLRLLLPRMVERGRGTVVNIASVNGVRYFGNPAYSAAKAALINLTQSVASEYGRHGIRCNAILPGSVKTDNITWTIRQERDPDVFKKLAKWYPLGRVAEPDDVAKAVSLPRLGRGQLHHGRGAAGGRRTACRHERDDRGLHPRGLSLTPPRATTRPPCRSGTPGAASTGSRSATARAR